MSRIPALALSVVLLMSALAMAQQQNPAMAQPQPATPDTGVAQPTAEPGTPAVAVARERDRAQIQAMVQQLDQAAEQNDVATMDRLLAPNYQAINAQGIKESKDDILKAHRHDDIQYEAVNIRDQNIQVTGDSATEQNTADVKGVYKGSRFDGTYSSTRTFQRQPDGSWRIVSFVVQKAQ